MAFEPTVVALLGYGRFGRALAGLLLEAGAAVRAYDPFVDVPASLRAPSLEALVRGAGTIIVAVPVSHVREAVESIAHCLVPSQLVIDVGSVKVKPAQALAETLASRIPWAATHPLFGPTSLALAERPLRVVICPNPLHPDGVRRARALYERIGCETLEQDAHVHDRAMAETHALAFFVAKGILEAGIGLDVPYAPPSFQAIARTVEVVRSDAGHLFEAIQRENPYADEARQRLIAALVAVDTTLRERRLSGHEGRAVASELLTIAPSDLGQQSPELREARELIDELDRELVVMLSRRAELARRAGRAKETIGHGVVDAAREARLLDARRAWAEQRGLDAEAVADIFRAVVRFSRQVQRT